MYECWFQSLLRCSSVYSTAPYCISVCCLCCPTSVDVMIKNKMKNLMKLKSHFKSKFPQWANVTHPRTSTKLTPTLRHRALTLHPTTVQSLNNPTTAIQRARFFFSNFFVVVPPPAGGAVGAFAAHVNSGLCFEVNLHRRSL